MSKELVDNQSNRDRSSECTKSKLYSDCSLFKFCVLLLLNVSAVSCLYEEYKKPTYLEGRVGGYTVFNCEFQLVN